LTAAPEADFSEAGRRLFAGNWSFLRGAVAIEGLPPQAGPEIAFAGRSNVGKSSLINALTGRKALARTSHTPGRTQELNFFESPAGLILVDLPGYGFAAAPAPKVRAWTRLIKAFLTGRATLCRVYLLIDARHGLKATDSEMLDLLDAAAVSYQVVLTKADAIAREALSARIASVLAGLATRTAAYPAVIATSSRDGTGVADLRAAIARLLAERGQITA
jgi:GTP-binding protein